MQVKLTKVVRSTTNKAGDALKTKDGRPYTRLSIKTVEHGEKWLSGFDGPQTKSWAEGQEVEIEVTQNGEYLNFSVPKKEVLDASILNDKVEMLLNRVTGIKITVDLIYEHLKASKKEGYPTEDNNTAFDVNDVPF